VRTGSLHLTSSLHQVHALVQTCLGTAQPPRELLDCCLSFVLEADYVPGSSTVPQVRVASHVTRNSAARAPGACCALHDAAARTEPR